MKVLIAVLITGIAVAGVVVLLKNPSTNTSVNTPTQNVNPANSQPETSNANSTANTNAVVGSATYINLTSLDNARTLAAGGRDVVLYFHAPWCPICRPLDASINANLNALPADLTIIKVDYDTSTDLKRQYGVTYQHTFVQIDGQGNKLKLWSGTADALDIAANVL